MCEGHPYVIGLRRKMTERQMVHRLSSSDVKFILHNVFVCILQHIILQYCVRKQSEFNKQQIIK